MKATNQLKEEHKGIMVMLGVLEEICKKAEARQEINVEHLEKIVDFLRVFVDKCHHGKEEDILFPEMGKKGFPEHGGPIAVMLAEHEEGRGYIQSMANALEQYKGGNKAALNEIISSVRNYIELLNGHIDKENNILFPLADNILPEGEQDIIFEEFEKLEQERIGEGKHEAYHQLIHELKEIYIK